MQSTQVQSVIESTEVRQERSRGHRFVIVNSNGAKSYYKAAPSAPDTSMNPGEELYELLPNNRAKLVYTKPVEVAP